MLETPRTLNDELAWNCAVGEPAATADTSEQTFANSGSWPIRQSREPAKLALARASSFADPAAQNGAARERRHSLAF